MDYQKMPGSTTHFAKYLLFGLNFLTFSLGVLLLAMSLWVRSDSGLWVYTENLSIERYYFSCYFGMAAGSLIFLISFVGCMGALIDSRLLMGIVSQTTIISLNSMSLVHKLKP
uniref:CD9 antigen n=1 Tax=Aceria tosichella TaxID=561515 RepID=A0A6G1SM45_9ACAR